MLRKNIRDVLEKPYPELRIDETTIANIVNHPQFYRGHVRISMEKIYTTDEFKKRSDEVLRKELP